MSRPSRLPEYLAGLYALLIVYASLESFSAWMTPLPGTPFFLFAPWPPRFTRSDVAINLLAYAPLGFFVALAGRRTTPVRLTAATARGLVQNATVLAPKSERAARPPWGDGQRCASALQLCNGERHQAGQAQKWRRFIGRGLQPDRRVKTEHPALRQPNNQLL